MTNEGVRPKLNTPQIHRLTDPGLLRGEYNIILLILGKKQAAEILLLQQNLMKASSNSSHIADVDLYWELTAFKH